jgi:hypothetical protein
MRPEHDKNHSLVKRASAEAKAKNGRQLSEVEKVQSQFSFDIAYSMGYAFKNFHMLPHGNSLQSERQEYERQLREHGNGLTYSHFSFTQGENTTTRVIDKDFVKIFYPGSEEHLVLEGINLDKHLLLTMVDKYGEVPKKRDDLVESSYAKRLTIGWSQMQPQSKKTDHLPTGEKLPFFSHRDELKEFPATLRESIGKVMTAAQRIVQEQYSNDNPFSDPLRSYLFGRPFAQEFSADCETDWEFLDANVQSGTDLKRHMDYMNGTSQGYQFGFSFSFLVKREGKVYRANMVLAARKHVDSWMEHYRKGEYSKNHRHCCQACVQNSSSTEECCVRAKQVYADFETQLNNSAS